jgi:ATP-binding protein involved in chromosome partitioning
VVVDRLVSVALQDARKALEMFHQVNVEVLGLIENMSQMTLPDGTVIDVFGAGATAQTAKQYKLPFLGSIDLDPQSARAATAAFPRRSPATATARGKEFLAIAEKVADRAQRSPPTLKTSSKSPSGSVLCEP